MNTCNDRQHGNEDHTVFVSNLGLNTTQKQLQDLFAQVHNKLYNSTLVFMQCGEVADIRLIKTKISSSGRPNVYAYVEYTGNEPIQQALLLDKSELNNRSIYVSPCNTSSNTKQHSSKVCHVTLNIYIVLIP